MDLGQKIRQARLDAGLSQRQLCGDTITRNMLSQIENGTARPSMDTLACLAARLERPIGYFLDEQVSSNLDIMTQARNAYARADYDALSEILQGYHEPDAAFDAEHALLKLLKLLAQAEKAVAENHLGHAWQLLEEANAQQTCYRTPLLEQQRLLLLAQVSSEKVELPSLDRQLLIRAEIALKAGGGDRCRALLNACEEKTSLWHRLQGETNFQTGDYRTAAQHFHAAEADFPALCIPRLERCYQAMEDYKRAYEYACKQR